MAAPADRLPEVTVRELATLFQAVLKMLSFQHLNKLRSQGSKILIY